MPLCAIEGEINDRYQAIIDVGVFKKKPSQAEAENPSPENRFRALIDTGAGGCGVSQKIAGQLGLQNKGAKEVGTVGGTLELPTYDIALSIPMFLRDGSAERPSAVIFPDLLACRHAMRADAGYDVLLGMNVIVKCSLCFRARKFALKHA